MTLTTLRDLSIILLVIEAFVMGLVPAVVFFFGIKGMLWAIRKLRPLASATQGYFRKAEQATKAASDRLAMPFIAASATAAQVKRWQHVLVSSFHSKKEV